MMYDWNDHGWGLGAWIAMGLMMLVFWGLIAVLVIHAVRNIGRHPSDNGGGSVVPPDQALRILDERFARGDIDAQEYNQRREVLRS